MEQPLYSTPSRQHLTAAQHSVLVEAWKASPITAGLLAYFTKQRDSLLIQAESLERNKADQTADLLVQSKTLRELSKLVSNASFLEYL